MAAGEDVRWFWERDARMLGLPSDDFYILDDERVATLRFTDRKVLTGIEVDDDPAVLE